MLSLETYLTSVLYPHEHRRLDTHTGTNIVSSILCIKCIAWVCLGVPSASSRRLPLLEFQAGKSYSHLQ